MKFKMNMKKMQNGPRSVLLFLFLFLVSLFALSKLADFSRTTKVLSYSEFLKDVEADKVKNVHLVGQEAFGRYIDGSRFEAVVAENPQNWEILKLHNVDFSTAAPSSGFNFWHFLLVIVIGALVALAIILFRSARGGSQNGNIFSMGKSKAKVIQPSQISVRFDDVAGATEAKEDLKDLIDFLKNPEKYRKLGAHLPHGVLLVGEPGNGKTLLAKAVAGEANCPFFSISGSDFIEVFVGVGAARIRDLFAQARKQAPSIIFIDEIDAIGRQRGSGMGGGHDEREQTLNQLLTEMDGFVNTGAPVIILAATNIPEVLDKALLRPGRFDRRIEVPYPDADAREKILRITTESMKLAADVNLAAWAHETAGFSGADIANLVNQAAIIASKGNHAALTDADFRQAYQKLMKAQDEGGGSSNVATKTNSRARLYMPSQIKVKFSDVAGAQEAKEELQDVIDFLKNPEKYNKLGAQLTRGVLLSGDPGNGKTLLAKAVAGEANCPFFSASGSEFVEMYVGVGAARVRDLFAQARKHAPCILFIDEIDAIGSRRRDASGGGDSEHNQTLNQLLTEMDGFDSSKASVIVLAATNMPDVLDKALMRPGRFDRSINVPYPDLASREAILRVHAQKAQVDDTVSFQKLARATPGFSGAELANLVNEAVTLAARQGKEKAEIEDFEEARDKIIMGKPNKSLLMTPHEIKMTAYHEAGHTIALLMQPEDTDPLYKVTIVPRGRALGVMHYLPERDKVSQSKRELIARMIVALAGRAAEELIFGDVSTGAESDFQNATSIAYNMVCRFGMSDAVGTVYYANSHQLSAETEKLIDQEVRILLNTCYKKALTILTENRDKLDTLAQALLEKELLDAQEVYELLQISPRATHSIR